MSHTCTVEHVVTGMVGGVGDRTPACLTDAGCVEPRPRRRGPLSVAEAMDAAFSGDPVQLVLSDDRRTTVAASSWAGEASATDLALFVEPCEGPTLDLGCGPGRLTSALARRGVTALGTDISSVAVRRTRARGAQAIRRDVYDRVPRARRWRHVLLADGNIGIGGDPTALLRRVARLLHPEGAVLVELSPHDTTHRHHGVRLHTRGRSTSPFAWATLGSSRVEQVAGTAGLRVDGIRTIDGRPVAALSMR